MVETVRRNWWLLALCGVMQAFVAILYFVMCGASQPLTARDWGFSIILAGEFAIAAGVFSAAASIWRSKNGVGWPLLSNGAALLAFGVIGSVLARRYPIRFLSIALLIILMAVSTGVLHLTIAKRLTRASPRWFFAGAGAVSIAFAVPLLLLAFRIVPIAPGSHADLILMGCYFAFAAVCTVALALYLHRGTSLAPRKPAPPAGSTWRVA